MADLAKRKERVIYNNAWHKAKMARDSEYAARVREAAKLRKREKSTPEQRAKWAEATRRMRSQHPEIYARERERIRERRQKDIVFFLLRSAKHRAIKHGRDYDLTIDWARVRWTGFCELSGLPFDWSKPMLHAYSPSLDRIDASRGYTQDNCRFILQSLNAFKGSASDEEMLLIAMAFVAGRSSSPT